MGSTPSTGTTLIPPFTGPSGGTKYTLSALRVPEATATTSSIDWVRKSIDFATGPDVDEVTIALRKTSGGRGNAWADNLTLPW